MPSFVVVPAEERESRCQEEEEHRRALCAWWREQFGEDIVDESLLDAMLFGWWTFAGWPPEMIDGPQP